MSQAKQRKSSAAQSSGLPSITLGKGLGLLAALLLTGAFISILMGSIGWAYLAFLVIGSLLAALVVEERGLFLLSLIHISEPTRRLRGSRMPSSA